jgi:LPXTG-motif cell wall-anchored protein
MWYKLVFSALTVVVSLVLTFAPVLAQESRDVGANTNTRATETDDSNAPELGWLGLIGLVGLGGLMKKRDHDDHNRADRQTHR